MNGQQGWQVLIIDDDEDEYILVRAMLEEVKHRTIHVDWAPDYHQGRKLMQDGTFHAVLVDYDLGDRTGIELIRESITEGAQVPMVLYTGRGDGGIDLEAIQAGAALYLSKAEASPHILERSLGYVIENRRTGQN